MSNTINNDNFIVFLHVCDTCCQRTRNQLEKGTRIEMELRDPSHRGYSYQCNHCDRNNEVMVICREMRLFHDCKVQIGFTNNQRKRFLTNYADEKSIRALAKTIIQYLN